MEGEKKRKKHNRIPNTVMGACWDVRADDRIYGCRTW